MIKATEITTNRLYNWNNEFYDKSDYNKLIEILDNDRSDIKEIILPDYRAYCRNNLANDLESIETMIGVLNDKQDSIKIVNHTVGWLYYFALSDDLNGGTEYFFSIPDELDNKDKQAKMEIEYDVESSRTRQKIAMIKRMYKTNGLSADITDDDITGKLVIVNKYPWTNMKFWNIFRIYLKSGLRVL